MTTIDHRILIPKSAASIWDFISDVTNNPSWQVDCKSLSILTPAHRSGQGLRWRYSSGSGREYVLEVTAWYDGIGYEYIFVDGLPFKEGKGRIRLQEIPEGTIVQWTLTYEVGGVLGGMRDAVGMRRQLESVLVDSLRSLWKAMQKSAGGELRESKSLMRDAPGIQERSQYRPRHPGKDDQLAEAPRSSSPLPIAEPPVSEEDTRPRIPIAVTEASDPSSDDILISPDTALEPSELETAQPPTPDSSNVSVSVVEPVPSPTIAAELKASTIEAPSSARVASLPEGKSSEVAPSIPAEESSASEPVRIEEPVPSTSDTSKLSVFDLFGLPKPSESQKIPAVPIESPRLQTGDYPLVVDEVEPASSSDVPARSGLRLRLRRRLVRLRRPV
ncbi:MAG: SRPBCC family protein [Anaerolineae bacterium]|nr:SRPBCC family protein [Anaerolineae bacterium]